MIVRRNATSKHIGCMQIGCVDVGYMDVGYMGVGFEDIGDMALRNNSVGAFDKSSPPGNRMGRGPTTEGRQAVSHEFDAKLGDLRAELDGIDASLLDLIRDRLDVCSRVALIKREFDIPMMQPGRVGLVTGRARDYAERNDLSPEFFEGVYRLLIDEACRVEDLIIDAPHADADALPDSSR